MLLYMVLSLLLVACYAPYERSKCNWIGAAIGAVASLAGGALNRRAQKKANAANSPAGQVAQWEAAGINPAFGISSGGYIPQQATSMGDAFAEAGGQFARALDMKHDKELRETNMELENEKLRKEIDILANPSDPSYLERYGGILPLPSGGSGNGQNSDLYRDSASAGPSPFPSHADDIGLPKRDVYNLYVDVYDPSTDRWMSVPNPDLMDAGPLESAYALAQLGSADLVQNGLELGGVGGETYRDKTNRPKSRVAEFPNPRSGRGRPHDGQRVYGPGWGKSPPRSIKSTQREIDMYRHRRNVINGL
ncbi:hypothetical protein [Pseudophaeobacter sp.]|uniref:hypothetical protein n=1 Tax=Pseudophaeobacter sp. TaxID=1971739 RepID=UPI004057D92D